MSDSVDSVAHAFGRAASMELVSALKKNQALHPAAYRPTGLVACERNDEQHRESYAAFTRQSWAVDRCGNRR